MPFVMTAADNDPVLAIALGRFSQACNYLERQIETSLYRLLPITDEIGRVLFAGNQMRRNIEIMRALARLPDVPLAPEKRERVAELCSRALAINDDRSRLLHNPIIGDPSAYHLVQHKNDGKNSAAMSVTAEFINSRVEEARKLSFDLLEVPRLDYDFKSWKLAAPEYPVRSYPQPQSQGGAGNKPRKPDPSVQ